MKKTLLLLVAVVLLTACGNTENQLQQRAAELCKYIPDHELLEQSKDYMTEDFYNVLDTMFNHLPEFEAMDHEWLYYFVTGNGGTIADYTVAGVEQTDRTHAVATISVRQKWEDGSFDESTDTEIHKLYMEKVNGQWLMSDFDGHKADCICHIAISRDEQARRDAIGDYLVREVGSQYASSDLCIPVMMIVAEEDCETEIAFVWGDFRVFNYKIVGDTLKCVSGGNHSGRMTISELAYLQYYVSAFWQTVDGAGNNKSAREIFGKHYDVYQNMHSNQAVREAVRKEQLKEYVKRNNLPYKYYQDYGWPAVEL